MIQSNYSETVRYRCLNEHFPHQMEDIYLTLCGIEQCTSNKERVDRVRDGYHLHVIMSGEGVLDTGRARTTIRAGQMFMVKPGERIAYWPVNENPWAYCWMSFNGARAADYVTEAGFTDGVYTRDCHVETEQFFMLCDRLLNTPQLNTASALKRLGLLLEFIGLSIESSDRGADPHNHRERKPIYQKREYVEHAVDYILNNYERVSVADVANYLGIDRSYFSSIFRKTLGVTPNEFILQVRMRESSHMLLNQSSAIQDIAHYVGYEDSLTFSKAFKRFFGVSPKYYREMPVNDRPNMDEIIAARNENAQQE